METQKPGQVVTPDSQQSAIEPPIVQPQTEAPAQPLTPATSEMPPAAPTTIEDQATPYQEPQGEAYQPEQNTAGGDAISWTASEYIAHHKSAGWYMVLVIITLALAVGVFFVTSGDITSVAVIVFVAVVFGAAGARKPKEQKYSISDAGVGIGTKTHGFDQFKSFSILDEDAFSSITFMPMKRFMPAISIYYAPQDEDRIVGTLSVYLPLEDRGHDPIDRFMKKIRF